MDLNLERQTAIQLLIKSKRFKCGFLAQLPSRGMRKQFCHLEMRRFHQETLGHRITYSNQEGVFNIFRQALKENTNPLRSSFSHSTMSAYHGQGSRWH